ncbi:hypothetical protein [Enterobacter cloacae]|uniref:hypothetical protein n=1 Tax=Enterobacter cloacae TaxID=550 RepID=UPI0022CE0316|nr:hypothetical protein [Enterobacter cloacae]
MAVALTHGADLTLTSLGRSLPAGRTSKIKIKRVDRAAGVPPSPGYSPYSASAPAAYTSMPFCVIAVDWTGWHDGNWYLLQANWSANGRSAAPLMVRLSPQSWRRTAMYNAASLTACMIPSKMKPSPSLRITGPDELVPACQPTGLEGFTTSRVRGYNFRLDGDKVDENQ